jgi:hypothetical protein
MGRVWIANDSLASIRPPIPLGGSPGKRLFLLAAILPLLVGLASISSGPAVAQECSKCKIPSGYATLPGDKGELCVNKLVACTCTPPGSQSVKSSQEMCLYKVVPGGGTHHAILTPTPH